MRTSLLALAGALLASSAAAQSTPVFVSYSAPPNADVACVRQPSPAEIATTQGITPSCPAASDARVRDLKIQTASLANDPTRVRLFLPPNFTPATKKYPVLLLLTGFGAGYQSWSCDTLAQRYVGNANVIVAMPDGSRRYDPCGNNVTPDNIGLNAIPSNYSDWQSPSSDGNPAKWEQFHTVELLKILKDSFGASDVYAVAGLSMGGAGAFQYAARHPGLFKAAAAYSGGLNWISSWGFAAINAGLVAAGQDTNAPWGYYPGTPGALLFGTQWPAHNPTSLAGSLLSIPLFVSVGDGSTQSLAPNAPIGENPLEFGARAMANDFVAALKTANGNVTPPKLQTDFYKGSHTWAYWDAELCKSLPMLMQALSVPYTPPLTCNVPTH